MLCGESEAVASAGVEDGRRIGGAGKGVDRGGARRRKRMLCGESEAVASTGGEDGRRIWGAGKGVNRGGARRRSAGGRGTAMHGRQAGADVLVLGKKRPRF
jgi:hypothetical protein